MVSLWEKMKQKNNTASISATVVHYAASVTTRPGGLQGIGA